MDLPCAHCRGVRHFANTNNWRFRMKILGLLVITGTYGLEPLHLDLQAEQSDAFSMNLIGTRMIPIFLPGSKSVFDPKNCVSPMNPLCQNRLQLLYVGFLQVTSTQSKIHGDTWNKFANTLPF
ncbi:hypothetical protein BYT27DRAFT_6757652 [Phlegmacium glaucopus]|nr:hypothetical protein BYT27DRAFT_6757652 [Phlegmacium glaucopus]